MKNEEKEEISQDRYDCYEWNPSSVYCEKDLEEIKLKKEA